MSDEREDMDLMRAVLDGAGQQVSIAMRRNGLNVMSRCGVETDGSKAFLIFVWAGTSIELEKQAARAAAAFDVTPEKLGLIDVWPI